MRDISHKSSSLRTATASATVLASESTLTAIQEGRAPKGDPLSIARVAATQAAKFTPQIIPYCHPIPIEHVVVEFALEESAINVSVTVRTVAKTGVEVEAMTAVAVAALNLYDLLKPIDRQIEIKDIHLVEKRGGKTDWAGVDEFDAAVVTVSDSAHVGTRTDESGPILRDALAHFGAANVETLVVPDDVEAIREAVATACGQPRVSVLLLTGGTGVGPRDVTPEAVAPLFDLRLNGVEEQLRAYGRERVGTAMISRSVAGVIDGTLVICLPGSPNACREGIAAVFPDVLHVLPMLAGAGH